MIQVKQNIERVNYLKPDFPVDAFAGTATYYLRYRVPYPEELPKDLSRRAGITGMGKLLDLACGPGRVTFALASSFREIWAIDREPEMIELASKEAAQRGVQNIKWLIGRVEELAAPCGSFALITIGEAFHRLDQQLVTEQSLRWLEPGGCLAIIGCSGITSGEESWQRIVAEVVQLWTGRDVSGGNLAAQPKLESGPEHDELVLRETGFKDVASYSFVESRNWTIETIIGNLYSTSFCSRKVLGNKAEAFEADLKAALLASDASGTYRENMRFGYTIGRKPKPTNTISFVFAEQCVGSATIDRSGRDADL
jgi:SAM-dependent methyltransferase